MDDILLNPDIVIREGRIINDIFELSSVFTNPLRPAVSGSIWFDTGPMQVIDLGGGVRMELENISAGSGNAIRASLYDPRNNLVTSWSTSSAPSWEDKFLYVTIFVNPIYNDYVYMGGVRVDKNDEESLITIPDPNNLSQWIHLNNLFTNGYTDEIVDDTEGDTSYSGGGNGSRDDSTDFIDFPSLPTSSALSTGFVNMVKEPNFNDLKNMLFPKDLISLDTITYTFYGKPIDYIIGLNILPFSPSASGGSGGQLGPYEMEGYSIGGSKITQQYQIVDLGEILVDEYFSSALDYAPSSKIEIYLPFVGYRNLNINDVMGKKISVRYYVDVLTGNFNCMLKVSDRGVLYSFTGNMLTTIPLNGTDFTNLTSSLVNLGVSSAISLVSGGAGSALTSALSNTSNVVSSMTPDITKDGNFGSSMGMLGVKKPFIKKEVPRQSLAKGFSKYRGFPSNLTSKLKNLKGYVEVGEIHLKNISATEDEKNSIVKLLESGVII